MCLFLKKLKVELTYDPAIPLLGIFQKKILIWKDTCTPVLTATLFTGAGHGDSLNACQQMEGWIRRGKHTMEHLSAVTNKTMPPAATRMDPETVHQVKQVIERKRNTTGYHLQVESKMWPKWTYLWNRPTHKYREKTCGCQGEGSWGWKDKESGISRCKLLLQINKRSYYITQEIYSTSCDKT